MCVYIYICKAYLTTKINCALIFCEKTGLEQKVSYHELPHNKQKYWQKETENLAIFIGAHGRERSEGYIHDVLDEVDELQDRSLDDLNIKILITHDLNSESGSQNGLQGVEVEDPIQEKQGTLANR